MVYGPGSEKDGTMEARVDANGHDIVVVGASAGGVESLRSMVAHLPSDLAASMFVVLHLPAVGTSVLPKILARAGPLPAVHASHGTPVERGCIYVAPPDCHMRLFDGEIHLDRGPKVNGHRPAVDTLFESAAEAFGGRVTGVILSGVLDDGAVGLYEVACAGGAALVQAPSDALYPAMPLAAVEAVDESFVGTTEELAEEIVALTRRPAPAMARTGPSEPLDEVARFMDVDRGATDFPQVGEPTGFTCPECHGSLWEAGEGAVRKFRCRTGHEFTAESLMLDQSAHVERALWAALRALEENAAMLRRMSNRSDARGGRSMATRLNARADAAVQEAVAIRGLLENLDTADLPEGAPT
jgi:two-component system chemotaxis response regulator CheB